MANVLPRKDSTPSSPSTHLPTFPRQPEQVYFNAPANGSSPSFEGAVQTSTGSQVDLLSEQSLAGNVELPPLNVNSLQGLPRSQPEIPAPPTPLHQQSLQQADSLPPPSILSGLEEWKSWKIKYPWLSFLLAITISLIAIIISLDIVSRKHNGFAPLMSAPGFLARDQELMRAIWTQGILYTSFPAFIMTIYRTMWESTVGAFADRQPYVDLKKEQGRPAKTTVMLDYKTKPALWVYKLAFQNGHYLLGLCFLTSMVLGLLVVPLVAFLFTTGSFITNTLVPLSILTTFDPNLVYPNLPDLRLSLNSAAAMRLQDARGPPWIDGNYAFPTFRSSAGIGDGNTTIETIAYSSYIDCKYIPESDYTKVILPPGTPGYPRRATTIKITANDRGCEIANHISVTTVSEFPDFPGTPSMNPLQNTMKAWSTMACSADSGWSRLSVLTARFVNSSIGITNFSLISCQPSYRITSGTLITTTEGSSEISFRSFTPNLLNMTTFRSYVLWMFFEPNIINFNCFDQLRNVDADEFMRNVYSIAVKRVPESPMAPEAMIDALSTLWSTTFAILASTELFKSLSPPADVTGFHSSEMSRLVVVSPIAYIILSVLLVVAILIIALFFYANQDSILLEEPVGLVSAAGILYESAVSKVVDGLMKRQGFDGKVTATMKHEDELMTNRYRYDEKQRKIVCYKDAAVPRKSWWKSLIEWARARTVWDSLMNRLGGR